MHAKVGPDLTADKRCPLLPFTPCASWHNALEMARSSRAIAIHAVVTMRATIDAVNTCGPAVAVVTAGRSRVTLFARSLDRLVREESGGGGENYLERHLRATVAAYDGVDICPALNACVPDGPPPALLSAGGLTYCNIDDTRRSPMCTGCVMGHGYATAKHVCSETGHLVNVSTGPPRADVCAPCLTGLLGAAADGADLPVEAVVPAEALGRPWCNHADPDGQVRLRRLCDRLHLSWMDANDENMLGVTHAPDADVAQVVFNNLLDVPKHDSDAVRAALAVARCVVADNMPSLTNMLLRAAQNPTREDTLAALATAQRALLAFEMCPEKAHNVLQALTLQLNMQESNKERTLDFWDDGVSGLATVRDVYGTLSVPWNVASLPILW